MKDLMRSKIKYAIVRSLKVLAHDGGEEQWPNCGHKPLLWAFKLECTLPQVEAFVASVSYGFAKSVISTADCLGERVRSYHTECETSEHRSSRDKHPNLQLLSFSWPDTNNFRFKIMHSLADHRNGYVQFVSFMRPRDQCILLWPQSISKPHASAKFHRTLSLFRPALLVLQRSDLVVAQPDSSGQFETVVYHPMMVILESRKKICLYDEVKT
jgi:hypothetical protein